MKTIPPGRALRRFNPRRQRRLYRVFRQCDGVLQDSFNASAFTASTAARLRLHRGLDREVLESIPTLVDSEVQEHKIGKGALECAICLNEFEDNETTRLLMKCDHVFHQECIDAWLDTHVTCPVCRTNYNDFHPPILLQNSGGELWASVADAPSQAAEISDPPAADHVAISVDDVEERKKSSLRRQTIRIGKSERWPSFFGRSLSAKSPAWASRKKMDEGSMSRKLSGVKSKVDFHGGVVAVAVADGSKTNANNDSKESSTTPPEKWLNQSHHSS
ncbi:E3 ubiquitin-protein ligase ATL31 [Platanthera guangdongensis]|uniref:RING-type E3 ubiquitin transferase n=1 Tax=Platanthera guangdongensis TaxID=2320717 RepID=A0ABR2LCL3_9ASPA